MVSSSTSNRQAAAKRASLPRTRSLLGGRYLILKQLAEGAFGHTLLAEDTHLPGYPKCVVKQLKPQTGSKATKTARRLFNQEAEVLYELGNHPQIPKLLAHFEDRNGFYLAQEYIQGRSLSQELKQNAPCSEPQVIQLVREILEVLVFVHQQQVIHRDLKPGNLIRRQDDGKIVMIDFGAVKHATEKFLEPAPGETDFTIAIGTVGYIPCEQLKGRPRLSSDIYAVGIIGVQALTGISPTELKEDEKGEIAWQSHAPQISLEFANVLNKMIRDRCEYRYDNALEALRAITDLMQRRQPAELEDPLPTSLPPTELHGDEEEPSSLPNGQAAKSRRLSSKAIAPASNHARVDDPSSPSNWNHPAHIQDSSLQSSPSSFPERGNQIPQRLQDEGMNLAVSLWRQRHRVNPWYIIGLIGILAALPAVERSISLAAQRNALLSANSVPPHHVLEPAKRVAQNLPKSRDPEDLARQAAQQIAVYLETAETATENGDTQRALTLYQRVLRLDHQNTKALTQRCLLLNQLSNPYPALGACEDLLVQDSGNVVAVWGLGKANYDMGDYSGALEYYNQALAIDPAYEPALSGRRLARQAMSSNRF